MSVPFDVAKRPGNATHLESFVAARSRRVNRRRCDCDGRRSFPPDTPLFPTAPGCRAFTLLELLVSVVVLTMILVMLAQTVGGISSVWRQSRARTTSFQTARAAFESLTRTLSQATLKTYWDYDDRDNPTDYLRASELHFVAGRTADLFANADIGGLAVEGDTVFFQSPIGAVKDVEYRFDDSLLSVCGYYIEFGPLGNSRAEVAVDKNVPDRSRYRLMEVVQPAERVKIYVSTERGGSATTNPLKDAYDLEWIKNIGLGVDATARQVLAENVIALILRPKRAGLEDPEGDEIAPDFSYDSRLWEEPSTSSLAKLTRNQLPPLIEVVMVALDDASAQRLENEFGNSLVNAELDQARYFTLASEDDFEAALDAYEAQLQNLRLSYRLFRTEVPIRAAKWSKD